MATCSFSFSGQGKNPREYPFPQYVYASIVMGYQLLKNNSHPWHPSPCHNYLYTWNFWWGTDYSNTEAVHWSSYKTRTFLLQTKYVSPLYRLVSLQAISEIPHWYYFIVSQRCLGISGPCQVPSTVTWTSYDLCQLSKPKNLSSGFKIQTEKWQVCALWSVWCHLDENNSSWHMVRPNSLLKV